MGWGEIVEQALLEQILAEIRGLSRQQAMVAEELTAFQEFTLEKFERQEARFDGLENRFSRLENRFDRMENRFNGLENQFNGLENEQRRTNLIIENEIRPSIQLLAEGQAQMQVQLDRIEEKVTAHEDVIFRRVK